MKLERREFFITLTRRLSLLAFPGLLASFLESCSSNNNPVSASSGTSSLTTINGSYQNGTVSIPVSSSSPLAASGSAAQIKSSNGYLLVDRQSNNTFNAMSAICTHQGCLIGLFDSSKNQFVCGCHGSRFSATGSVVQGPAGSPLPTYKTNFANNQLNIQVG